MTMWFKFPEGSTQISVQQQEFNAEAKDDDGGLYFRAPDHFAPIILSLGGFKIASPPDGTDLPELPAFDPDSTRVIANLTGLLNEKTTQLEEVKGLLAAAETDRDKAMATAVDLGKQLDELKKLAADEEAAKTTKPAEGAKKS